MVLQSLQPQPLQLQFTSLLKREEENKSISYLDLDLGYNFYRGNSESKLIEGNSDSKLIDMKEILEDDDLYSKFATMFVEDQEAKANEKDAEKEKEEQNKVKDKNGAGAA